MAARGPKPVRLLSWRVKHLSIREWGVPSHTFIGKVWRAQSQGTITCILPLPGDPTNVRLQTRRLEEVFSKSDEWVPAEWRDAMQAYAAQWPASLRGLLDLVRQDRRTPSRRMRDRIEDAMRVLSKVGDDLPDYMWAKKLHLPLRAIRALKHAHGPAKLSASQVLAICRARGTNTEIAERYGVNRMTISRIRRGLTWRLLQHAVGGG